MTNELHKPIAYLEDQDFDNQGNLAVSIPKKVAVIMIQASWCPHCTSSKPAFQEFADKFQDKVFCATIQADGQRDSEKKLGQRIRDIKPDFKGFPDYMLIIDGKRVDKDVKGRGVNDLIEFSNV